MNTTKKLKITCLVEDTSPKRPFWGEHGLSFLIEADDKKILFDTGWSGMVLKHNLEKLDNSLDDVDILFLSHSHDDHTGGLKEIADSFTAKPVFCATDAFSEYMPNNQENKSKLTNITYLTKNTEISPGIIAIRERAGFYSPKPTNEVNLVVNVEDKGLIIIIGCSHHGLENILTDAKSAFPNTPIYALVGGLHLKDSPDDQILKYIDLFGKEQIKLLLPNHCTGFNANKLLTEKMPECTKFISKTDTGTFHTGQVFIF